MPNVDTWTLEFVVENRGEVDEVFETSVQRAGSAVVPVSEPVPAGERRTVSVDVPAPEQTGDYIYGLSGWEVSVRVSVTDAPALVVRSFTGPEAVKVGDQFDLTLTVANTSPTAERFESDLEVAVGDGEFGTVTTLRVDIPDRDTVTTRRELGPYDYIQTVRARLAATDDQTSVVVRPRQLAFGERYELPDSAVQVAAQAVELTDSYEYTADGATATHEAPDGSTWVLVDLRAENLSGQQALLPSKFGFDVRVDGEAYGFVDYRGSNEYTGGEVFQQTTRTGVVLFEVPAGTARKDLMLDWRRSTAAGTVGARWADR